MEEKSESLKFLEARNNLYDVNFKWKTRNNELLLLCDMDTRNLFSILRMIWSNLSPNDLFLSKSKAYHFGDRYNRVYLKRAVVNILAELEERNDLRKIQKEAIEYMKSKFTNLEIKG